MVRLWILALVLIGTCNVHAQDNDASVSLEDENILAGSQESLNGDPNPPEEQQSGFLPGQTYGGRNCGGYPCLPGQTLQPWAQDGNQQFLSGQTWQPWAQPGYQPGYQPGNQQFLSGQTWQPWAQPGYQAGNQQFLPGQTWQPWAQPGGQEFLSGQTWQPWAQPGGLLGSSGAKEDVSSNGEEKDSQTNMILPGQTWKLDPQINGNPGSLAGQTWQPWAQPGYQPDPNMMLPGQTLQPWAQDGNQQFLSGQTWQPWAQPGYQPRNQQLLPGQTWQPWAQPGYQPTGNGANSEGQTMFLPGQTWQPWARPHSKGLVGGSLDDQFNVDATYNDKEDNFDVSFSPFGSLPSSASGEEMVQNNDNEKPMLMSNWGSVNAETIDRPSRQDGQLDQTQDTSSWTQGNPTWTTSWAPMQARQGGRRRCFNRCKPRCGSGFGRPYGCRPSCRSSCNLRPTCGSNRRPQYNGNTMVCPLAFNNGGNSFVPSINNGGGNPSSGRLTFGTQSGNLYGRLRQPLFQQSNQLMSPPNQLISSPAAAEEDEQEQLMVEKKMTSVGDETENTED